MFELGDGERSVMMRPFGLEEAYHEKGSQNVMSLMMSDLISELTWPGDLRPQMIS